MKSQIEYGVRLINQGQIPELPFEVQKIKEKVHSRFPNTAEIGKLVNKNPRLLSKFLNIANACLSDPEQKIKNAKDAIEIIGLEDVSNNFYSAALMENMVITQAEGEFFLRGIKLSIIAQELSSIVHNVSRSEAYLAALMSEIGSVVFNRHEKGFLEDFYKKYQGSPFTKDAAYIEKYHTNLDAVSALVCKKWNVNPLISKAILLQNKTLTDATKPDGEKITNIIAIINLSKIILCEDDEQCYLTDEMRELRKKSIKTLGNIPSEIYQNCLSALKEHGHKFKISDLVQTAESKVA